MATLGRSFTVDTAPLLAVARQFENGATIAQEELLTAMEGGLDDLYGDIKDVTPRCRTGKLQDSLEKSAVQSGKDISGTVKSLGSIAPYNEWVHDGRGPVVAKPGKALKITFCDGTTIFRKRVRAAKANPFMDKGLRKAESGIQKRFDQAETRIAARLEGGS
jgi:hypothetical protein